MVQGGLQGRHCSLESLLPPPSSSNASNSALTASNYGLQGSEGVVQCNVPLDGRYQSAPSTFAPNKSSKRGTRVNVVLSIDKPKKPGALLTRRNDQSSTTRHQERRHVLACVHHRSVVLLLCSLTESEHILGQLNQLLYDVITQEEAKKGYIPRKDGSAPIACILISNPHPTSLSLHLHLHPPFHSIALSREHVTLHRCRWPRTSQFRLLHKLPGSPAACRAFCSRCRHADGGGAGCPSKPNPPFATHRPFSFIFLCTLTYE